MSPSLESRSCGDLKVGCDRCQGNAVAVKEFTLPVKVGYTNHMKKTLLASLLGLALGTVVVPRLDAQVLYGSLVVEARDESGAAVPGADVTITQTETGLTRSSVSNNV